MQAKIGTVGRQVETLRAVNPLLVKQTMSGALSISAAAQTATAMASSVRIGPLCADAVLRQALAVARAAAQSARRW